MPDKTDASERGVWSRMTIYTEDGAVYTPAQWAMKRQLDRIIELLELIVQGSKTDAG